MIVSVKGNKRHLLLVFGSQGDLVKTLKGIQKAHPQVSIDGIYQLINLQHGKWTLKACSIQVNEVGANPQLAILLFNLHGIRKPLWK